MPTLSQLADLGELIGGIAVVASLVYLAIQIRQNTRMVRGTTLHQNTDLWSSLFFRLAEPDIAQAYVAGMTGRGDIRPSQYTQFFFICRAMFVAFENQYYQMRQGVLDPETYAAYERSISTQLLAFRGFRIWWEQSRSVFSPAFIAHLDGMIAAVPEHDSDAFFRDWQAKAEAAGSADRQRSGQDA
jgi:hypothetical protein